VSPPLRVWVDYDFQNVPGTGAGVCPCRRARPIARERMIARPIR
jgi:hypothetical protein